MSVVVATRNRSGLLPRLLRALEAQEGAPTFEVVFVDDASTDDTTQVLAGLAASSSLDVQIRRMERNQGPAGARNVGWRSARAPLIAFTDDDCVPQPPWLEGLARALAEADVAQGRTEPNPHQAMLGWFSRAPQNDHERGFYETCNMGYRAETLEAVGGFDERFGARRPWCGGDRYMSPRWGEDTDLAWRAKEAGAQTAFVASALVWHDMKAGRLRDELADLPRRQGSALLVKRHPGVRSSFESRWFVQSAHAPALGGAAALLYALAAPGRLPRWLLAAGLLGAWSRHRGAYYPKRLWPRTLPQWFLVDLADAATMAVASVRHRTLLL